MNHVIDTKNIFIKGMLYNREYLGLYEYYYPNINTISRHINLYEIPVRPCIDENHNMNGFIDNRKIIIFNIDLLKIYLKLNSNIKDINIVPYLIDNDIAKYVTIYYDKSYVRCNDEENRFIDIIKNTGYYPFYIENIKDNNIVYQFIYCIPYYNITNFPIRTPLNIYAVLPNNISDINNDINYFYMFYPSKNNIKFLGEYSIYTIQVNYDMIFFIDIKNIVDNTLISDTIYSYYSIDPKYIINKEYILI